MGCVRCGECCIDPSITIELNLDLAKFYSMFGVEVSQTGDRYKGRFRIPTVCRYFTRSPDGKGSCDIYEDRPEICRDYPKGKVRLRPGCGYTQEELVQLESE